MHLQQNKISDQSKPTVPLLCQIRQRSPPSLSVEEEADQHLHNNEMSMEVLYGNTNGTL